MVAEFAFDLHCMIVFGILTVDFPFDCMQSQIAIQ